MKVKELRLQTGLSQSKFAKMFDIPLSTLKDWEQERRNPPAYVINMMRTILQYNGMIMSQTYIEACEIRRSYVENAMAITLSATIGPDELFLKVWDSLDKEPSTEQYKIAKTDYETFREKYSIPLVNTHPN